MKKRRGCETMPMIWQYKVSWSGLIILGAVAKVRHKKGDTLADAITIAGGTISVGAIWWPEIRVAMAGVVVATPLVVPAAAVVATAYAAGGVLAFATADPKDEGWYGVEALKEYYEDPIGTTTDTIVKEVSEAYHSTVAAGTIAVNYAVNEAERQYQVKKGQVEAGWDWVEDNWRWSNPTPGPWL